MIFTTLTSSILLAGAAIAAPAASAGNQPRDMDINAVIPKKVPINTRGGDQELITKLMTAATQVDRAKLLDQPGDFIFDFKDEDAPNKSESKGKGGFSIAANSKTMPSLIGTGSSMTVAFLGPCGMNTAHVHNRATELNIVVKGRLVTNFVLENGAKPIENTLDEFQMAAFPQGAIHQEFNPDCDDAVFVASFNNEDPGVNTIAQNFFSLRPDVVTATLGGIQTLEGKDIESFQDYIPENIALGIHACLKKCGITRSKKRDLSELLN